MPTQADVCLLIVRLVAIRVLHCDVKNDNVLVGPGICQGLRVKRGLGLAAGLAASLAVRAPLACPPTRPLLSHPQVKKREVPGHPGVYEYEVVMGDGGVAMRVGEDP